MTPLKQFKLSIEGTYCDVPHEDRKMEVFVDTVDKDNPITDIDILIICNEICCFIRNKLRKSMKPKEFAELEKKFEKFHFGGVTEKSVLRQAKMTIWGYYCEEKHPERKLNYSLESLTEGQAQILLYEILSSMRNKLSETMTREQLHDVAIKFNIQNLGMLKDEMPFVTRD